MNDLDLAVLLQKRKTFAQRLLYNPDLSLSLRPQLMLDAFIKLHNRVISAPKRLVSLQLIGPGLMPDLSNADYFGVKPQPASPPWDIVLALRGIADAGARRDFIWRLAAEARLRCAAGWYPVFWTLTIRDRLDDGFDQRELLRGRDWDHFIRGVMRATEIATYSRRHPSHKRSDFFSYAAVCEGLKSGRPHLHVVTFHRQIPASWRVDPNAGLRIPTRQELPAAKVHWPHGFSSPRALRFSHSDCWAKLGFKWPVQKGRPLPVNPPSAIGLYLGKYQTKEEGLIGWRKKISRNLGMTELQQKVSLLGTPLLRKLDRPWRKTRIESSPNGAPSKRLIRLAVRRERISRVSSRQTLLALIKLRDLTRPDRSMNFLIFIRDLMHANDVSSVNMSTLGALLGRELPEVCDEFYCFQNEFEHVDKRRVGVV